MLVICRLSKNGEDFYEKKLETLSLVVLREFAKDKKLKNISSMRKAELIDALIAVSEQEKQEEEEQDKQDDIKEEKNS